MSDPEEGRFPEVQEILIERPIYWAYDISKASKEEIWGLEYLQGSVDAYCMECRDTSILESDVQSPRFHLAGGPPFRPNTLEDAIKFLDDDARRDRRFEIELSRTRDRKHRI